MSRSSAYVFFWQFYELAYDPAIPLLGIYQKKKKKKKTQIQKDNMHLNVYSSIIYNCQDMEANKVSID